MTVRARLRSHLQTSGVLDLPRLGKEGADLIDISLEKASYQPEDFPIIHVAIQSETSDEDTSDLTHQIRSAVMTVTVHVSSYHQAWRPPRSYYDEDYPATRSYTAYSSIDKDDLRHDLEAIAQEASYRIRRDDLTQLDGILSVYDTGTIYTISEQSNQTVGQVELSFDIMYKI